MSSGPTASEVHALLDAAERAAVAADEATLDRFVPALVSLTRAASQPGSDVTADPALIVAGETLSMVKQAYEGGWQPLDLLHVARWKGSRASGTWIGKAILREADRSGARQKAPQRWIEQLDAIEKEQPADASVAALRPVDDIEWRGVLDCLGVLHGLPTVEVIMLTPSMWDQTDARVSLRGPLSARPEDKMLLRIRSLLAKAESTEFPAEADALTAKAQDLMTRHAIDEALVRAQHAGSSTVAALRIVLEPPYTKEKAVLLHVVAKANHSTAIWNDWAEFVTVIGAQADVDHIDMLFTSLLVQATRAMTVAGEAAGPESRSIGFRKSFLSGYAVALGERLNEAAHDAEESYGASLLPVLAAQQEAIREEVDRLFPRLRPGRQGASSFDARGWTAGQAAADSAVLPTGELGTA